MKNTVDFYNKTAADWAARGYGTEPEIPCMFDFARQFPAGSRFLDLCCGCGYETRRLQDLGFETIGLDFSAGSLAIAKEKNPDIVFHLGNMLEDYSFLGPVDAIFCIAGLVHIGNDNLPLAFKRMHNVLTPGGYLFLTVRDGTGKLAEHSLVTIDGEDYDRNFIAHTLAELTAAASGLFAFVEEVGADGSLWRNYIFRKEGIHPCSAN